MSVRIITDSASELEGTLSPALTVLPLSVSFGEEQYWDGETITRQHFYELLIEGDELPVTSQINPAQYEAAFRSAVESGEDVVVVTLSSKLSGTYQSALIAAESFPDRVFVVDSENATIGEGLLVQRALQYSREGLEAAEIARRLEPERKQIRLVALLDTLEYLKRGGRLPASAAFVGGLLNIKPVIAVEDGEVKVLGKARGSKNGNNLLVQQIQQCGGIDFDRPLCLGYTGLDDGLLQKYIRDSSALWTDYPRSSLPICTIGASIGTHVGPGAIAVAFFCKA